VPGQEGAALLRTNESRFVVGQIAPATKPGQYAVFLSVGQQDGTPRIALPLEGEDGQRRYRLGQVEVRGQ